MGIPTFCTDPLSLVKEPEEGVTYLPEGMSWSEASTFVAAHWFTMKAPWCIEGIATVRALRKFLGDLKGIQIKVFENQFEDAVTKDGQRALHKGVMSVWNEIKDLPHIKKVTV